MIRRNIYLAVLFILLLSVTCIAGQQTISGVLVNDAPGDPGYYYISLGSYSNPNSLQSQVFKAYPTKSGRRIWYANNAWTLNTNRNGQHITIKPANVANGYTLQKLLGKTFSFTYQTTNNVPVLTIFPGTKSWLVVPLSSLSSILQSTASNTLHSSIAYSTNYDPGAQP
ncbi:MAG: hypothetical protein WCP79_12105 [Bacillota bacterium]